jgi:hypothetical protein
MMKLALAAAALLVAAGPAPDHGGKVKWTEPKNAKEFDALIAQATAQGRAGMIFFTMDG